MGNAALVIDNLADAGIVTASSQALTMPAINLLSPHPSERWRSLTGSDFFVLNKGASILADTASVFGLTCGINSTVRLRLSALDPSAETGEVLDTGAIANGAAQFDVEYGSFVYRLPAPAAWQYARFDIEDPDADFVEAGCVHDGLSAEFAYNFSPSGGIQHVDRSRLSVTASGQTLVGDDNTFRRVDLSFDWVSEAQRFGVIERLDRVKGRRRNVLLMTDTAAANMPRASIYGLVTDQTPVTFTAIADIFGKQLRIDERI